MLIYSIHYDAWVSFAGNLRNSTRSHTVKDSERRNTVLHLPLVFPSPSLMIKSLIWIFLVPEIQCPEQPAQLPFKQQPLLCIKTNTKPNYKEIVIGTLSPTLWCSGKIPIHSWQNVFPPVDKKGLMDTARTAWPSAAFILNGTCKLVTGEVLRSAGRAVFFSKGNLYIGTLELFLHHSAQIKN